mmetsp:Transcript_41142/g.96051  ORF Transcript_41142/g.96051 Transcript_41142/m.96051 type:complete len:302 (-) Transcript_41142:190-1095(-)
MSSADTTPRTRELCACTTSRWCCPEKAIVEAADAKDVDSSTKRSEVAGMPLTPRTQSRSIRLSPEIFSEKASNASTGVTTPFVESSSGCSSWPASSSASFSFTRTQFCCDPDRRRKASDKFWLEVHVGTDVRGFMMCLTERARAFSAATDDFEASSMPLAMSRAERRRAFKGRPEASNWPLGTWTSKWWQENLLPVCSDISLAASTRGVSACSVMGGTKNPGSRAGPSFSHLSRGCSHSTPSTIAWRMSFSVSTPWTSPLELVSTTTAVRPDWQSFLQASASVSLCQQEVVSRSSTTSETR